MSAKYYIDCDNKDFASYLCLCVDGDSFYLIRHDFSSETRLSCLSDIEWQKDVKREIKSGQLIEISNPRFIYSNEDL